MTDPKNTSHTVESAIAHIFANNLPLNLGSLLKVVRKSGGKVTQEEIKSYMSQKYGWTK